MFLGLVTKAKRKTPDRGPVRSRIAPATRGGEAGRDLARVRGREVRRAGAVVSCAGGNTDYS